MTLQEFITTSFGIGDAAIYKNETWLIKKIDFEEGLFSLIKEDDESSTWVRCESIVYVPFE